MSYRTVKHIELLSEPMGNKPITKLPGIGDVRASRLNSVGITTASQLAALFKRMGPQEFQLYLNEVCGANSYWASLTITALEEYNEKFGGFVSQQKSVTVTSSTAVSLSKVPAMMKDEYLKELFAKIASLQMLIQQHGKSIDELNKSTIPKYNALTKLPEIVELLQVRSKKCIKEVRELEDAINSTQSKVDELDDTVSSKDDELENITDEIRSLEMRIEQIKKFNEDMMFEQRQRSKDLSVANKKSESVAKENSNAIECLKGKTRSTDTIVANSVSDLNAKIALKDEEIAYLTQKMDSFTLRIRKVEETNVKLERFIFICGINAVLLIVFTCSFFVLK